LGRGGGNGRMHCQQFHFAKPISAWWMLIDMGIDGVAALPTYPSCLGPHSRIETPSGGLHLVFAQPNPPVTYFKWCKGVEILGTSSLLTCYDLDELKFPHVAPRAILPEVFRKPRDPKTWVDPIKKREAIARPDAVYVADVTAALREMDPCDWRGEYLRWFALMTACCFEGISERDFVNWSIGDPQYAADGPLIRRMWRRLSPQHGGALFAALAERGIKVGHAKGPVINKVHPGAKATRTVNIIARCKKTCDVLEWARGPQRRDQLFNSACVMAEMVGEGRLKVKVANDFLRHALRTNGLWREDKELCETIIGRAYRHVELKMLGGESESATNERN
jgi:hypothetical protein